MSEASKPQVALVFLKAARAETSKQRADAFASFSCPLLAGPVSGRTMRVGSPSSKASSTLCRRRGRGESLESSPHVFHTDRRTSFLGCPAKGSPIPKFRVLGSCRKSCRREDESSSTDRPSLDWLPSGRRSLWSIARRMPRLLDLPLCLVLTHQAEADGSLTPDPPDVRGE
jgi:hypothetical protein